MTTSSVRGVVFAGMPADGFDSFDTGLSHVVNRLRTLLTEEQAVAT